MYLTEALFERSGLGRRHAGSPANDLPLCCAELELAIGSFKTQIRWFMLAAISRRRSAQSLTVSQPNEPCVTRAAPLLAPC